MRLSVLAISLFVALSGSLASPARANDLLAAMDGRWKGEGWAKRTLDGAREVVRCRIANTYFSDSRELVVSGKCAVPGKKFDFRGAVSSTQTDNAITGRWANPFGFGSTPVAGTIEGRQAVMNFSAPDPSTKKDVAQQMTWRLTADGFRITSRVRGSGDVTLSDLRFRR